MRNDATYLDFIAECLDTITRYVATAGDMPVRDLLEANGLVRDGVVRRLEVPCDATGKLTPDIRERHPTVPWGHVTGFRNVLAHAYLDVDLDRVAEIIATGLPRLRDVVAKERGR